MEVIASAIPVITRLPQNSTTALPGPIRAGRSNNVTLVAAGNGIDVANTTETPSQDASRPDQAKRAGSQSPCPKRRRLKRAASPNPKAVGYGINNHPVYEVIRPNYYSLTIRHKQNAPLNEELGTLNLFKSDEKCHPALDVESKSEEATVSKTVSSSFDCHTTPVRKNWAGNKYNTRYHPPNDSLHEVNQSKASPLVKGVSVQHSSRGSITPPRPNSDVVFPLDDIFDRGYVTTQANTNLLQHTSVDPDPIHPATTVGILSSLRARKKKRSRKSTASGTFFEVFEDPPNLAPHVQKRNFRPLATSEMDLLKENFTVAESESAS